MLSWELFADDTAQNLKRHPRWQQSKSKTQLRLVTLIRKSRSHTSSSCSWSTLTTGRRLLVPSIMIKQTMMMENKRGRPQSLKITKRTINIDIRATFFTVCVTFILFLHRKTAFDFFLTVFISTHFRRISKNFNLGRSVFNKEEFHVFPVLLKMRLLGLFSNTVGGWKLNPSSLFCQTSL